MLPEMPGQILHLLAKLKKLSNAMLLEVEAGIVKLAGQGVLRIRILPGANEAGEAIQRFGIQCKDLANFAGSRLAAIGDYICRHRGPEFSVALVNVLDCAFPLVTAREVQIDIRPFAALFGKKPFKEKIH